MANLNGLDHAIGLEITAIDQVVVVNLVLISTGEPSGALDHVRVHQVTHRVLHASGFGLRTKHHRADVAGHQFGVVLQIFFIGLFKLSGGELGFQSLHIHSAVARHTDDDHFAPRLVMLLILRVLDGNHHVLEDVGSLPFAAIGTRVVGVGTLDHVVDSLGIRGGFLGSGRSVGSIDFRQLRSGQSLDVPSLAGRSQSEGVFTNRHRGKELLGSRAAHRTGHGEHRHVLQVKTLEDALVGTALVVVGLAHAFLVDGEGVGILHDEFAAANQTGARAELVAVLGLDLVQGDGQVFVRGVHVLDQKGEHLLVGGGQQVVGLVTVLETEDVVAVFLPAVGGLVRLARQQSREVHFLSTDAVDLLTNDGFNLVEHLETQRQPGPDAGRGLADVAGTLQQFGRIDIGIGGILAQGAQEHG